MAIGIANAPKEALQSNRETISGPVNWPTASPAGTLVVNTPTALARVVGSNVWSMRLTQALQINGKKRPATVRAPSNDQYDPLRAACQLQRHAPSNPPAASVTARLLSTRSRPIPAGIPVTAPTANSALTSQLAPVASIPNLVGEHREETRRNDDIGVQRGGEQPAPPDESPPTVDRSPAAHQGQPVGGTRGADRLRSYGERSPSPALLSTPRSVSRRAKALRSRKIASRVVALDRGDPCAGVDRTSSALSGTGAVAYRSYTR